MRKNILMPKIRHVIFDHFKTDMEFGENSDSRHGHYLNSTCDIGDPSRQGPLYLIENCTSDGRAPNKDYPQQHVDSPRPGEGLATRRGSVGGEPGQH